MDEQVLKYAKMIDHTLLKPNACFSDFDRVIEECKKYQFAMLAINSFPVKYCKEQLKNTNTHVGAAIGFPLGQTTIATKCFEVEDAIGNGCDEIDYVINITQLKNQNDDYIYDEMQQIVNICKKHQILSKVIFENCLLSRDEMKCLCEMALLTKIDFVKTSTGFSTSGATIEDVYFMKSIVQDHVQVKAAGGIRDVPTFLEMIKAGATRIGTSSGVAILESIKNG